MPLRNLTDEDIQAIATALRSAMPQEPLFTADEIVALKGLAAMLKETRSVAIKTIVGIFVTFCIGLLAIGFKGYFDVR